MYFSIAIEIQSQVTIGSDVETVRGSLLDIKEQEKIDGSANSVRGIMLPRVNLSDLNELYPMFVAGSTADKYKLPGETDEYDKAEEKKVHAGLTVYNLKECNGFAKGMYLWSGTEWRQLTKNTPLDVPSLSYHPALTGNLLEIPSGKDARAPWTGTYGLSLSWKGTPQTTAILTDAAVGGLSFSTYPLNPVFPATLTSNPTLVSIRPDNMTDEDLKSNLWLTRESKIVLTADANECGPGTSQTITLNQTNYSIKPSLSSSINGTQTSQVQIKDTQPRLYILSNVKWTASPTTETASNMSYVINPTYTTSDGVSIGENLSNSKFKTTEFIYTGLDGATNSKYKTVDMIFSDDAASKRANDVTVTFLQCKGSPDMSTITVSATNAETSGADVWGDAVVHHQAKTGVYAEFYSAKFGNAGRWMTTNLAATSYDGNTHSQSKTLDGPNANPDRDLDKPYWCYPGTIQTGSDGTNSSIYDSNKHHGYLYTWDAATAGKGGDTGKKNIYNLTNTTTDVNNERATEYDPRSLVAGTPFPGNTNTGKEWRIQGVCPKGWHLPNDYEWFMLQKEIIRNTTKYADIAADINPAESNDRNNPLDSLVMPDPGTTGILNSTLGKRYGAAMKDICEPYGSELARGVSKKVINNGFAILLAGEGAGGNAINYGTGGEYWTSSSYPQDAGVNAIHWFVSSTFDYSISGYGFRSSLLSVRCKKD